MRAAAALTAVLAGGSAATPLPAPLPRSGADPAIPEVGKT
eukprot:COSAG05_NODE_17414_length_325_cov_1.176991_1_plen_39_part_01